MVCGVENGSCGHFCATPPGLAGGGLPFEFEVNHKIPAICSVADTPDLPMCGSQRPTGDFDPLFGSAKSLTQSMPTDRSGLKALAKTGNQWFACRNSCFYGLE